MELKKVFNKKTAISSILKVPFSKNISGMTQCPSNPGFVSIKVQNVDFLKKPSVDNILFSLQGSQVMETGFSLLGKVHRENPVVTIGMGLQ